MPLIRLITWVSSISSSRSRQRSTAAAGSSPIDSSTMAACSTGVSATSCTSLLFRSAIFFLHPLFDHFRHPLRLLAGQDLQVVDHYVHGRTGRGQIVVLQQ